VLDRLVLADRPTEDDALLRVAGGTVERGAPETDRLGGDQDALRVHAVQDVVKAFAVLADAVRNRHLQPVDKEKVRVDRVAMVDRGRADLSVRRQCALLGLARSGVYRQPAAPDPEELTLMRWIGEQYLATPFYGSRRMTAELRLAGRQVNRKRVQRLMRLMGLAALGPKPKTSRPAAQHRIYPYLLRGLAIDRPNQVWAADITYIPMARGFLYLVVVMDWHSRYVLAWRLSNTMDTSFCLDALEEVPRA
jgi:hypothetical protein